MFCVNGGSETVNMNHINQIIQPPLEDSEKTTFGVFAIRHSGFALTKG